MRWCARRPGIRPFLVGILLVATLFAGCTGPGDDAQPAPGDPHAGKDGQDPPPPGAQDDPLPGVRFEARHRPLHVAFQVALDGDPDAVAYHRIDWDDGTPPEQGDGPPKPRYLRNYPPPDHWRDPPARYEPNLTLMSATGHIRTARTEVVIDSPPNAAPTGALRIDAHSLEIPATVTFEIAASDPDGTIQNWRFDPGDGAAPHLDQGAPPEHIPHTYRTVGIHTARLQLTDDGDQEAVFETTVQVLPPQSHRYWTHNETTAYQHDPNGTVLSETPVVPTCLTPPCAQIRGAGSHGERFHLAIDDPEGAYLLTLHAPEAAERTHPLPERPTRLQLAPDGTAWTTHANGTIAWTHPTTGEQGRTQIPALNATHLLEIAPTGTAWILETGPAARLHHVDPATGQVDPLLVPTGRAAVHLAINPKHRAAVVVDTDALAWVALPTLYGPRVAAAIPIGPGTPLGVACPTGHDRCWVVLDGASPGLVAIDLKTLTATPWTAPAKAPLPTGLRYGAPVAVNDRIVVPAADAHESGHLVIDPANGAVEAWAAQIADHPPSGARALEGHTRLVPHLDGAGSFSLLDLDAGRIVHRAAAPGGANGPYPVRVE